MNLTPEQLARVLSCDNLVRFHARRLNLRIEDEDAIQECRLRLCVAVGRFMPELGRWETLATTVVKQALIDLLRRDLCARRGRRVEHVHIHAPDLILVDGREPGWRPPLEPLALAARARLTPSQSRAVRLVMLGLTHAEAAQRLGVPAYAVHHFTQGAVRRMRRRARIEGAA